MITCKICNKKFKAITETHLKNHQTTGQDYKQKFPGSVLKIQSPESKLKISASKTGKESWNKGIKTGPNEKLSAAKKGKSNLKLRGSTRTAEQKENISRATKAGMVGKMTEEVKQKLRDAINKRKLENTYVCPMKGKNLSDETKMKISISLKEINLIKSKEIIEKFKLKASKEKITVVEVEDNYWFKCQCSICNSCFTFSRQIFRASTKDGKNICPTCHPRNYGRSKIEQEFYSEIVKLWPTATANDRLILGGKEIDVLIPELNLGFEFTGLYWHSDKNTSERNHLLHKKQYAFKKGITLITVFEDEWRDKKELVLSRIRNMLGINSQNFHARKCEIKEIDSKEKSKFLDANHLQGNDSSTIKLGLRFKDELIMVATFKKTNISKGGDGKMWELSRLCTKINCNVSGGASKLITYFNKNFNTEKLTLLSYADSRWSTGKLYATLRFKFAGVSKPSYWYLLNSYSKRVHRASFMKHKLIKCEADKLLTEWDLAQKAGLDRIWDCGTTKWLLEPK